MKNSQLDPVNRDNFKPIRINFVHATQDIVGDQASNLPGDKFPTFMEKVGGYVQRYFQTILSVYPLESNFVTKYSTKGIYDNTSINIDIKKYLTDSSGKIIYVKFNLILGFCSIYQIRTFGCYT
jgi:hypothetical protein